MGTVGSHLSRLQRSGTLSLPNSHYGILHKFIKPGHLAGKDYGTDVITYTAG